MLQLKIFPLECRDFMSEQTVNHLHRLFETVETAADRVERNAVRLVLVLLPGGADPEDPPTVAHIVCEARGEAYCRWEIQ